MSTLKQLVEQRLAFGEPAVDRSEKLACQKLGISYKTVVNISWQLKKKLEADNLQALVRKAARLLGPADRP